MRGVIGVRLALILSVLTVPLAQAERTFSREGPSFELATANPGESLKMRNNGAVAIDEDGYIAVAFNRSSDTNLQVLRAIGPDGSTLDYLAAPVAGNFGDSPGVVSQPGNRYIFTYFAPDSDGDPDLSSEVLELSDVPSETAGQQTKTLGWHNLTNQPVALQVAQGTGCTPARIGYLARRNDYVNASTLPSTIQFSSGGYYMVQCQFGRNYYVKADYSIDPANIERFLLSNAPASKGEQIPNSALPSVATALTGNGPVAVYAGQQAGGGANLVTLLELSDTPEQLAIDNIIQLDQTGITSGFGPVLAACGHDEGLAHYWVAYTDNTGKAILVRMENGVPDYQTLGSSRGPIDIACDNWGNALVAWWSGDGNESIQIAAVAADGSVFHRFSENLTGILFNVTVNAVLNANGEAAVLWSLDDQTIHMRRYRMDGHFAIDGTLSGSMFSPGFAGEGFAFDIAEIGGQPSIVLYYFTYQSDGSGEMAWLVGSGALEGNQAQVQVAVGSGATFGEAFDPANVELTAVGTVELTFLSCRLVLLEISAGGFGDLSYIAQRLTGRALEVDGTCGEGPPGTLDLDASWGGSLFSVARNGEGFFFDIVRVNDVPTLVLYYFTYLPDGSGKPAWLVGSGPIVGRMASVDVGFGSGATFGPGFDPASVTITPWGNITVSWISCVEVLIEYDGLWATGSFTVEPLTGLLIGSAGLCQP